MILMNDFTVEPVALRNAMLAAVGRVLDSGWYVLGNEVAAFEKEWAAACGVAYGVGVGNGLDAIELALRAQNIGHGDEVITTPMTAFATVLARRDSQGLPGSERHAATCLSLPCHPQLTDSHVEAVIAAVNNFKGE